ncbi:hypothetical protein BH11PSE2_BH11PSE2_02790 [soil metagenome]
MCHLRDVFFAPFSQTESASTAFKAIFYALTRTGQEAVMLFFVISGFLVGGSCIRRLRLGTFSASRYTLDRLSRIYVPLLPVLLLTFAIMWLFTGHHDTVSLLINLFSLQGVLGEPLEGDGALWSLSYEVWFYVLAGALCVLFGRRSLGAGLVAFFLFGLVFAVFTRLLPGYLFVWGFGACAFCLPRPQPRLAILIGVFALVVSLSGVALMQLTIASDQVDSGRWATINPMLGVLVCSIGLSLVVYLASFGRTGGSGTKLNQRVGAFLASFSYTLYLVHLPIHFVFRELGLIRIHTSLDARSLLEYMATLAVILTMSYGLYWCAERHTGRVRSLLYRWAGIKRSA